MSKKVNVDAMAYAIMEELKRYSDDLNDAIKVDTRVVAQETVKELKATSPKKTGAYAKSWAQKESVKGNTVSKRVVYNKEHYRLTHLLEKGHALVGGGRAPAHPHIHTAEVNAVKNLEERIKKTIQRG